MSASLELIAQPTRAEILRLVWTAERSAGEIARHFRTTFGAVSQHIGRLWRAGALRRRREGKQLYYVADRAALGPLAAALEAMWADRLAVLKTLAEERQQQMDLAGRVGDPAPLVQPPENHKTPSAECPGRPGRTRRKPKETP